MHKCGLPTNLLAQSPQYLYSSIDLILLTTWYHRHITFISFNGSPHIHPLLSPPHPQTHLHPPTSILFRPLILIQSPTPVQPYLAYLTLLICLLPQPNAYDLGSPLYYYVSPQHHQPASDITFRSMTQPACTPMLQNPHCPTLDGDYLQIDWLVKKIKLPQLQKHDPEIHSNRTCLYLLATLT